MSFQTRSNSHKLKDIKSKYESVNARYNNISQDNINLKNMNIQLKSENIQLKSEFESILNSNSWKVTFPLREISRWLRNKLQKNE